MLYRANPVEDNAEDNVLPEIRRRAFLRYNTFTVTASMLVSCSSASSSHGSSPFDNCSSGDFSLLYFGFTGEDFFVLDTCGFEIVVKDRRFAASAPIQILGIGNGGDLLLASYVYDYLREKDPPIYIYNMVDSTYRKLYGFTHAAERRVSANGNVIVGFEDPGPGNRSRPEVVVYFASISPARYEKFTLKLRKPSPMPNNIGLSADGRVIVFSQGNNIWRLEPSDGTFHFVGAGKGASCSPDGTRISFTSPEGKLVIQSLRNPVDREVLGLAAVDGLEWYPTGDFGVAAEPSWIPPLGFPRPDNLYFVDVNQKRWRRLTLQRGWIGATSLRWITNSIHLRTVLEQVHRDIAKAGDPEDWFDHFRRMQSPAGK